MVLVRINNTGERITIPHIENMKIKDIIIGLENMQYPYKLEFCGKNLDEHPESLISDFDINEESTIFLFNTYKSDIIKLNNEITSLNSIIEKMKQEHISEKTSLNSRINSNNNENSSLRNQISSLIQNIESLKLECKKQENDKDKYFCWFKDAKKYGEEYIEEIKKYNPYYRIPTRITYYEPW